ncbi:MAG TPA: hypothetical protein VN181_10185 [Thermoanaerobaculia bacterium]|nr:hypothetical protein [Thermoanaerobaculia bacterium]
MLATDANAGSHPHLETWADNERMRHVPSLAWIVEKLDVDLRHRIEALVPALDESTTRALCRALDRLADLGRHTRTNGHAPNELGARIAWALDHTVSNVKSIDANLFGRRFPMQTHERSKAEPLYAALLVVIEQVKALETAAPR